MQRFHGPFCYFVCVTLTVTEGMDEYLVSLMTILPSRFVEPLFLEVVLTTTDAVPADPLVGEMLSQEASVLADQGPSAVMVMVAVWSFFLPRVIEVGLAERLYFSCWTWMDLLNDEKSSQTTVTIPERTVEAGALSLMVFRVTRSVPAEPAVREASIQSGVSIRHLPLEVMVNSGVLSPLMAPNFYEVALVTDQLYPAWENDIL